MSAILICILSTNTASATISFTRIPLSQALEIISIESGITFLTDVPDHLLSFYSESDFSDKKVLEAFYKYIEGAGLYYSVNKGYCFISSKPFSGSNYFVESYDFNNFDIEKVLTNIPQENLHYVTYKQKLYIYTSPQNHELFRNLSSFDEEFRHTPLTFLDIAGKNVEDVKTFLDLLGVEHVFSGATVGVFATQNQLSFIQQNLFGVGNVQVWPVLGYSSKEKLQKVFPQDKYVTGADFVYCLSNCPDITSLLRNHSFPSRQFSYDVVVLDISATLEYSLDVSLTSPTQVLGSKGFFLNLGASVFKSFDSLLSYTGNDQSFSFSLKASSSSFFSDPVKLEYTESRPYLQSQTIAENTTALERSFYAYRDAGITLEFEHVGVGQIQYKFIYSQFVGDKDPVTISTRSFSGGFQYQPGQVVLASEIFINMDSQTGLPVGVFSLPKAANRQDKKFLLLLRIREFDKNVDLHYVRNMVRQLHKRLIR